MLASKNPSKQAGLFFALLVCTTLLWADNKPWKSKPYQTWDAKDVQTIMTDSPWVSKTTVRRSWDPSKENTAVQPVQQEISGGVRSDPTVMGPVRSNTGATDGDQSNQQVNTYVYWYSSRLIRAAAARQSFLRGSMDQTSADKFTDAPQAEYQIVLRMDDMTPFTTKDEKFYQQNAFLQMRRSNLKLPPSKVLYERLGTTMEDVVFFFPKTADGAPTIASDETDVVFSCKVADQTLHADFKPKTMVDQFGPDL
ncbi:MAG TPA: hypothetical protein VJW93_14585 [Candidatus Acidoferrales bacterium]|nr:hypothetical protein [Candidatus Acidoferrales bacterium]